MLANSVFKDKYEINRKGLANKLIISDNLKKGTTLEIDKKNNVLRLVEGNQTHLVLDKFAVNGLVKMDMFFINGGLVIELIKGMIIVDLGHNNYALVTKKEIEYVTDYNMDKVKWLDSESLLKSATTLVTHKYGLKDKNVINNYVHNLSYNLVIYEGSKSASDWGLSLKFINFYTDLGLDKFDFQILKSNLSEVNTMYKNKKEDINGKEELEI